MTLNRSKPHEGTCHETQVWLDGGGTGQGMMGPGMMGPGVAMRVTPIRHLSADDPRHFLEHRLAWLGCKRLVAGSAEEKDEDTIIARIVSAEGAVVQELELDRRSGFVKRMA